jgi:Cytochrome P460
MNRACAVASRVIMVLGAVVGAICQLNRVAYAEPPRQVPATASSTPARVTAAGKLMKPADLTDWVFLGTSLGMGYNPGSFNAGHPGQFQVVLMEPQSYRYFVEHGDYAPGSMFLLSFYDSDQQQRSINRSGFTQGELTNFEIHVIDPRGEEGHSFYLFGAKDVEGTPVPKGNACVRCHVDHGAFRGTFAQFYPTLRPRIPADALERAARDHDIR